MALAQVNRVALMSYSAQMDPRGQQNTKNKIQKPRHPTKTPKTKQKQTNNLDTKTSYLTANEGGKWSEPLPS